MIEAIAVVVPARDEADRVVACLRGVRAAGIEGLRTVVVLVADACEDDTVELARAQPDVEVVVVDHANVGASRAEGVAAALAALSDLDPERMWIASTDADSVVPVHWLSRQLRAADAGWDAVLGTVRPDEADLPVALEDVWWRSYRRGSGHGHVHGANLGVRASAYLRAGGFHRDAQHEDVRLVARLRAAGCRVVELDDAEVVTSGRLRGRTPGGYAGYLSDQLAAADERSA